MGKTNRGEILFPPHSIFEVQDVLLHSEESVWNCKTDKFEKMS